MGNIPTKGSLQLHDDAGKNKWWEKMKRLREAAGQSQEEFGARWGASRMAVSYWERGIYEPSAEVLIWVITQPEPSE
jgi:DNA-binding XRE family transcriptional regulator